MCLSRLVSAGWYRGGRDKLFCEMSRDSRFSISENMMHFMFDFPPVDRYDVDQIRLGDIRRYFEGRTTSLYETPVYSLIAHDDEKAYRKYVSDNRDGVEDIEAVTDRDIERFRRTIASMMNDDYDIRKCAIVIDSNNVILDGMHRTCALLYRFGPTYKIPVVRVWQKLL